MRQGVQQLWLRAPQELEEEEQEEQEEDDQEDQEEEEQRLAADKDGRSISLECGSLHVEIYCVRPCQPMW